MEGKVSHSTGRGDGLEAGEGERVSIRLSAAQAGDEETGRGSQTPKPQESVFGRNRVSPPAGRQIYGCYRQLSCESHAMFL